MATAKQQLEEIIEDILDSTSDLRKSKTLRLMGKETANIIRRRTRLKGRGVNKPGGRQQRLKALKKSTKDYRKFYGNKLHSLTSPNKSNLTFTGQLLNSIKLNFVGKGRFRVGPSGKRKDIFGRSTTITNEEVAEFVSEERPFNFLSKREISALLRFMEDRYDDLLDRRGLLK